MIFVYKSYRSTPTTFNPFACASANAAVHASLYATEASCNSATFPDCIARGVVPRSGRLGTRNVPAPAALRACTSAKMLATADCAAATGSVARKRSFAPPRGRKDWCRILSWLSAQIGAHHVCDAHRTPIVGVRTGYRQVVTRRERRVEKVGQPWRPDLPSLAWRRVAPPMSPDRRFPELRPSIGITARRV